MQSHVEVQAGAKPYWFRMDDSGAIVGGVAKFVDPLKGALTERLGLKPGCLVGITTGMRGQAQKTAGVMIKMLGALVPGHMDKERYEFCWIVDFPMYEIGEESGELEFCHNPFSMPAGGLDILLKAMWRFRRVQSPTGSAWMIPERSWAVSPNLWIR